MALNADDQKFYEDQFDLFLHPGWKAFVQTITNGRNGLMDKVIQGADETWAIDRYRGRIEVLSQMTTYEANIKEGYEAASESSELEEAEDE